MKKGIFGGWFKELASLIFTQTVQAFLLAIIMSIIVNALTANGGTGGTYGAGLLAIIALSQFNKIELLIKNIFGVTSQYGGRMDQGKGGLLGTMMALKMGKKALDNVPKMVGGTRNALNANRTLKNLRKEKSNLELDKAADGAEADAQVALNSMGEAADKFIDDAQTGAGIAAGARMVNGGGSGSGVGISSSQIDQLISAVKEQTSTLKTQKADGDKKDSSDRLKSLNQEIEKVKSQRRQGIRTAVSGALEGPAGLVGAAGGAIVGLGMGDNVVKNAAIGYGVGDSVISGASKMGQNRDDYKTQKKVIKIESNYIDEKTKPSIQKNEARIKQANNDERIYKAVTQSLNNANESGFMKNRTSQDRAKAVKKLQENTKKKIDASNL